MQAESVSKSPVIAKLHYLERNGVRPVAYVGEPPAGEPQFNGVDDPRDVLIEDGRGREAEFSLDKNGFQLLRSPSQVQDFYSPDEVEHIYYPEVDLLLRTALGVTRTFIFDHTIRNASRPGARLPVRRVHNDQSAASAARRVQTHLPEEADTLLQKRFGIVNVWRPIRGPVQDSPLALCDATSFQEDDLIPTDLVYPHMRGETLSVAFRPSHRWVYFSQMERDEVAFIRVHDSASDGRAKLSFHTSFENSAAPDALPRESIEVRALVFFP